MTQGTDIAIGGNGFGGYLSLPPGGRGPGLLVFHAVFGVNDVVRSVADDFARQGYAVLCPDLFWRQEPGVQLSEKRPEDFPRGVALFSGFDMDAGLGDLDAALSVLRAHPACTGRVGAVGYCFGGRMAYMMAAHTDIDAAVSYYGTAIERHLDCAAKVHRPLMLHLAEKDKFVSADAQQATRQALDGNPKVVIHVYPGADHAFARIGSPTFDAAAASLANERTATFLRPWLW